MKLDKDVLKIATDTAKAHLDTAAAHVAAAQKPEDIDAEKVSKHLTDAAGALAVAQKHIDDTKPANPAPKLVTTVGDKTAPSLSGTSVLLTPTPEAPKASSKLPMYIAAGLLALAVIAGVAHQVFHVAL